MLRLLGWSLMVESSLVDMDSFRYYISASWLDLFFEGPLYFALIFCQSSQMFNRDWLDKDDFFILVGVIEQKPFISVVKLEVLACLRNPCLNDVVC